ncbi:MAG: fibrobacter succinogenes major paralogous domain-containing protein [Bacteroidales bacterium]|nr:fibrobacter succinogenes major paralogous domain-containing protein [Bacteroidales bacterium]
MRNILTILFSLLYLFVPAEPLSVRNCSDDTPGWGESLGTVSFASDQTWTIGSQTWSDAVQATNCNKTFFYGGLYENFASDCRSNPDYPGDLFSWCAVARFKNSLCPAPWRVPTRRDFIDLDKALGGSGKNRRNSCLRDKYLNDWGGIYGGLYVSSGILDNFGGMQGQGWAASYWSQSEGAGTVYGVFLGFETCNRARVRPREQFPKFLGLSLRCVK